MSTEVTGAREEGYLVTLLSIQSDDYFPKEEFSRPLNEFLHESSGIQRKIAIGLISLALIAAASNPNLGV